MLFSPTLVSFRFPAPVLAVVSTVIVPTAAAVLPSCRNTVVRNESGVDGVGVGEGDGVGLGVGVTTGVGVGVGEPELETEPQPTSQNESIRNNSEVILRSTSSPKNLGFG